MQVVLKFRESKCKRIYLFNESEVKRPELDNWATQQAAAEHNFCTRRIRLIKLHFCIFLPVHSLQRTVMHGIMNCSKLGGTQCTSLRTGEGMASKISFTEV